MEKFNPVHPSLVLWNRQERKGDKMVNAVYLGDKKLENEQIKELKREVKELKRSNLWKLLMDYLLYHQQEYLIKDAKNWDDTLYGRAAIYNLRNLQKLVDDILSW